MSKSNATETDLLALIFTATALPWAAATELDIHLHTADPGEAGTSATNEATYTSYAADDTTPLYTADLWQDAAGTVPYAGAGADRRDRLE